MPTIFSTSADRCAMSCLEVTSCASIASLNCAPMDLTGLSAFIALCMTTDMSFHLIAVSDSSVSPTRFVPLNITLPFTISAGGDSSCATANSNVDLPHPDSPTTATNSPGSSEKLTLSTASTVPPSSRYSTDKSATSRMALLSGRMLACASTTSGPRLARLLATVPPVGALALERPQRRVADFVKRVVKQRERGAEKDDAQARCEDPQCLAGLVGLVVLRRLQHRAPAHLVGVAQPDELQAAGEQHRVQRVAQEAGDEQRRHRRNDLDDDDVEPPLAAHPRGLEEVAFAQRQRLTAQLPGGVGPAGQRQHRDHHARARAIEVPGDHDQQREQRYHQQDVRDEVEHAVPGAAEVGGGHADQHRDRCRCQADGEGDLQHGPGAPDHLGEQVLAEAVRAKQVMPGRPEADLVLTGDVRVAGRDHASEGGDQYEED